MVKTGSYYFLSRPRRFGKSLLISTLEAYFQGKKELFEGLAMEKLEKDWIRYPVLHLDLNIEKYDTPESLDKILHDNLDAELHEFAEARGVSYDKLCDYLKAYYDGYHLHIILSACTIRLVCSIRSNIRNSAVIGSRRVLLPIW